MRKLIMAILSTIGLVASVAMAQGNERDPRTPEERAVSIEYAITV